MPPHRHRSAVAQRGALAMLVVAVLTAVRHAAPAVGLRVAVRLAPAIPGCVPAWSADRAPPGRPALT